MTAWLPALAAMLAAAGLWAAIELRHHRPRVGALALDAWPLLTVFVVGLAGSLAFHGLVGVRGPKFVLMPFAGAALLPLLPAFARGRARLAASGVVLLLFGAVLVVDVVYWRFFRTLAPLLASTSGGLIWDVKESVLDLVEPTDVMLLPVWIVAGVLLEMARRGLPPPANTEWAPNWRHTLIITATLAGCIGTLVDVSAYLRHRYSWKVFDNSTAVEKYGLISAHARDVSRTARERWLGDRLSDDERKQTEAWFAERNRRTRELTTRPAGQVDEGRFAGRNVLILQIEALQEWATRARLRKTDEPLMPFWQELTTRGRSYTHLWDLTGGSPTSDCEAMVLTSQHPLPRGAVVFRRSQNDFVTLVQLMRAEGYETLSAHAYRGGMWNRTVLHPRWGFERSLFRDHWGPGTSKWGIPDDELVVRVAPVLAELSEPWLAFVITVTSHHPYRYLPKRMPEGFSAPDVRPLRGSVGGYVRSMRYVDDTLRTLFSELERLGLDRNTIVVLYGDHDSKLKLGGEDQRRLQKAVTLEPRDTKDLAVLAWRTKRVPLLIVPPSGVANEGFAGSTIRTVGGQIDIGPTLLHLLGVPLSPSFAGEPLAGQPGHATRYDGAAVTPSSLFDPRLGEKGCLALDGSPLPPNACLSAQAAGQEEVAASQIVTLHDLARQLHEGAPPASNTER